MDDREEMLVNALRAEEDGEVPRAISYLEGVLRLVPSDVATRTWLGRLYADREQFAAAVQMLQSALAIDSERARTHTVLAEVMIALGRYAEAETAMRRSIDLAPTSPSYVLLAYALISENRRSEAQEALRRALELEPENEEAMYNLALEFRSTNPAEALALLKSAVHIDPLYAAGYREYGFQLALGHDLVGAEDALRRAIAIDGSDSTSHVYLANVLASTGHADEAEAELRVACDLAPLAALPRWGLGKLLEEERRFADAEACFRTAADLGPTDPEALYQLGRFLVSVGTIKEARQWLNGALEADPSHEAALALKRRISPSSE